MSSDYPPPPSTPPRLRGLDRRFVIADSNTRALHSNGLLTKRQRDLMREEEMLKYIRENGAHRAEIMYLAICGHAAKQLCADVQDIALQMTFFDVYKEYGIELEDNRPWAWVNELQAAVGRFREAVGVAEQDWDEIRSAQAKNLQRGRV